MDTVMIANVFSCARAWNEWLFFVWARMPPERCVIPLRCVCCDCLVNSLYTLCQCKRTHVVTTLCPAPTNAMNGLWTYTSISRPHIAAQNKLQRECPTGSGVSLSHAACLREPETTETTQLNETNCRSATVNCQLHREQQ